MQLSTEASPMFLKYCKFGENFVNNVKGQVCDVKNSWLEHDLPTSESTEWFCHFMRVLFSQNFALENKTFMKISEFTVADVVNKKTLLPLLSQFDPIHREY